MAAPLFSTLFNDASLWDDPDPDYDTLLTVLGGTVNTDRGNAQTALVNLSLRTPTAVAYILETEPEYIYIGHSPALFPADITMTTTLDNRLILHVGDVMEASVPMVVPAEATGRIANTRVFNTAYITGANGHGAGPPPVYRFDNVVAGGDSLELQARRIMLLPPSLAGQIVASRPQGRYSLWQFWNELVNPLLNGTAAQTALIEPVRDWYLAAVTDNNAGESILSIAPVAAANPIVQGRLNAASHRIKKQHLLRLGIGGPGLTTAAFQQGIQEVRQTLETTAQDQLQFERDRNNKTFTDKHGDALAQRMHRLCGVADDRFLPEVHQQLAKAPKGRDYGILGNLFSERSEASRVPLTAATRPLPTTKLVEDVFRSFQPSGTGITFGQGLTPFAIVCEGHAEMAKVQSEIKHAEMAQQGTSLTLADAARLTASDVRFPTDPQTAAEKLYG